MILADKIIDERKKLGFSQEELAEKLSVSRQAVSKWESAQSIPELAKIVAMSELFSVSTDYLLKDDMEPEKKPRVDSESERTLRLVTMEEANAFLAAKKEQSRSVALGVLLCIISPVLLIILAGLAEADSAYISETWASVIGLAALFALVASAVYMFVRCSGRTERFDYIQKEGFETAYGVTGLAKEKKAEFEPTFIRFLSLGIVLCVLSPLPVIFAALISESDTLAVIMTAALFCLVAAGVYMIIRVSVVRLSYQALLQEGDFDKAEKKSYSALAAFSSIYWCLTTAVYLVWSFLSEGWERTWIVWVIAGVLCAPVTMIAKRIIGCDNK